MINQANANGHGLFIERALKAPREKIWRCWTERDLLTQWFCPEPWVAVIELIDLRPGGAQTMVMQGPEGERFPFTSVYLEVIPNDRLVVTNAFAPGWIPVAHPHPGFPEVTIVELKDAPGGGTLYRAGTMHWTEDDKKQHEAMGFYEGWGKSTDQLEALAQKL